MMDHYDEEGIQERVKPKVARRFIAEWACDSWNRLPKEIIYNSWRRPPYSYFPDELPIVSTFGADFEASEDEDDELSVTGI